MQKAVKILLCFLYFLLSVYLGGFVPRTDFYTTITIFTLLFGLLYFLKDIRFVWLLILGLGTRFVLCFVLPELSDDYYRFVWDGILNTKGINPYLYRPSELLTQLPELHRIYDHLNSQDYYSVYPSINQYTYTIGAYVGDGDLYKSTVIMKLMIFVAECVSVFCLIALCKHFALNRKISLLYILNPLILLEFCGNLHFEGFMITMLLLSVYLLTQNKVYLASVTFSIAICLKIMPLIFLPLFIRYLGLKKGIIFTLLTLALSVISFSSFDVWNPMVYTHILESINLYFSSFEFNSSIFRIMQFYKLHEHEYLKFIPKIILLTTIGFYFLRNQKQNIQDLVLALAIVQLVYLVFSQSIHPWYVLPIVPFALLSKRLDAFVWSYLIAFTYITYQTTQYTQSLPIICLEYILLIVFIGMDYKLNLSKKALARLI